MRISVTASITRTRPHIFIWVRNFHRFGTDEDTTTTMLDAFDSGSKGGLAAKLSKKERYALQTILFHTDDATITMLLSYAESKGMNRKTAFSLDGLCAAMFRNAAFPTGLTPKYETLLSTTKESRKLCLQRMMSDNEKTPDALRKPLIQVEVDQLLLSTSFLINSLSDAKSLLAKQMHTKLVEHCTDLFLSSALDVQLNEYITLQPECYVCDMLPVIRDFSQTQSEEISMVVEQREKEAADKVMTSTLDEVVANATGDQSRFESYLAQRKATRDQEVLKFASWEKCLQTKGRAHTETFVHKYCQVSTHVYFTKLPTSQSQVDPKLRPQRYVTLINTSVKANTDWKTDDIAYWHLLDVASFNIEDTHFADTIAAISTMAVSAKKMHAVMIVWPVPNGAIKGPTALKQRRTIEDMLTKAGLTPEFNTAFRFQTNHGNDTRPCNIWCSVAMIDASDNVFSSTNICMGKTSTDSEILIAQKDMTDFENVKDDVLPDALLNKSLLIRSKAFNQDRLRQRGVPITHRMVLDMITGNSLVPETHPILFIEYFPTAAIEFTQVCRKIALQQLAGNYSDKIPKNKIMAVAFASSNSEKQCLEYTLSHSTYTEWFQGDVALPHCGMVGAKQLPEDQRMPETQKPVLKLGFIVDPNNAHTVPVLSFPAAIKDRFARSPSHLSRWNHFLTENERKYGVANPETVARLMNDAVHASQQVDLGVNPPVNTPTASMHAADNIFDKPVLDAICIAESPLDCPPRISLMMTRQDGALSLYLDGSQAIEPTVCPKHTVLLGFGCGDGNSEV